MRRNGRFDGPEARGAGGFLHRLAVALVVCLLTARSLVPGALVAGTLEGRLLDMPPEWRASLCLSGTDGPASGDTDGKAGALWHLTCPICPSLNSDGAPLPAFSWQPRPALTVAVDLLPPHRDADIPRAPRLLPSGPRAPPPPSVLS